MAAPILSVSALIVNIRSGMQRIEPDGTNERGADGQMLKITLNCKKIGSI